MLRLSLRAEAPPLGRQAERVPRFPIGYKRVSSRGKGRGGRPLIFAKYAGAFLLRYQTHLGIMSPDRGVPNGPLIHGSFRLRREMERPARALSGRRTGGVAGTSGTRGTLFGHYCQYVKRFQPKAFVFENVIAASLSNDPLRIAFSINLLPFKLSVAATYLSDSSIENTA